MAAVAKVASYADVPALVDVWCNSMNNAFLLKAFPHTPGGLRWLTEVWERATKGEQGEGNAESTVLIARNDEGRVVSAMLFWIVPQGTVMDQETWRERWPKYDDIPEMNDELVAGFFNNMAQQHQYVTKSGDHVFVEGLMTHKDFRRQGFASQLLKCVSEIADELDLDSYLDAGRSSMPLYQANGFKEVDLTAIGGAKLNAAVPMLRPRRSAKGR